jgi:dihydroorotase
MLIRDGTLADGRQRDVRVSGERIAAVAPTLSAERDERVYDAAGKRVLPGAVDVHVHFREPGHPHKETWTTGSRSAAAGGVTTVVDQPNTEPPTTTGAAFDEKADLARDSLVDFGLNGGVLPDWEPDALFDRPLFALGEVFLADSTGDMGVDLDAFRDGVRRATEAGRRVTVHAEDASLFEESARERPDDDVDAWSAYRTPEAEVAAVDRAVAVGVHEGARVHVAHTSTPAGIDRVADARMTCEVTPHHMLLSRDDLDDLGTFGRMNPPLRDETRRRAVYDRVADGTVDVVATDHAPHTRAEKDASVWDAPSGVPGVETMLPLLLAEAVNGRLTYERVVEVTARNPATLFDLPEKGTLAPSTDADLVVVDPDDLRPIRGTELHSKADWTPFEGHDGVFPELTMVRGHVVYEDGAFGPPVGRNVRAPRSVRSREREGEGEGERR